MRVQEPPAPDPVKEDLSGQSRLGRNVVFAWGGYLVNVVAGFIMPRLISDRLGQTTLGIWDFAWSVVSYFGLVQLGLSGSVNRYVARYRATHDNTGLSKSVSTIGLSLKISAVLVAVLSIVTAVWIVPLFRAKLGTEVNTARWVVLFLGLEVAGSLLLTVYGAIIVGCHRWDIHNSTSAISYAVMTMGMIAALLAGGGLGTLALVHWISMNLADVVRWRLARRVCPEFVMDFRLADWSIWKEQARYSAKGLLPRIAELVSNQSLAILITMFLGPAMLAVYSRPRNLMRQGQSFTAKFGSILIPTASSLHARGEQSQLQSTFFRSTSFISSLAMPGVAILVVLGNELIRLWMGSKYIFPGLMTVLAIGCFPSLVQEPVWSILSGMNRHGRLALCKLVAAICSAISLGLGLAFFHWSLLQSALAFAIPLCVVDSLVTPVLACQVLGAPVGTYYVKTYLKPLIGTVPFAVCLGIVRGAWKTRPFIAVGFGILAVGLLALMYGVAFAGLKHKSSSRAWPVFSRKKKGPSRALRVAE